MLMEHKKEINETIIKALIGRQVPWRGKSFPRNIVTRLRYDGVNPLLLNLAAQRHSWASAYWGTTDQWLKFGCHAKPRPPHLRIGQWCQEIVLYKPRFGGTMEQDLVRWTVFNLDQIANGFFDELRLPPKPVEFSTVDGIIKATKAKIIPTPGLEAAYYYAEDHIVYPLKEQFVNGPGGLPAYYNSLFHELIHWVESRLKFDAGVVGNELRAEVGADYLCTELGIPCLDIEKRANHLKHIDRWVKMMREDPDLIFRITAEASKSVDFILAFSQEVEPRHNPPFGFGVGT